MWLDNISILQFTKLLPGDWLVIYLNQQMGTWMLKLKPLNLNVVSVSFEKHKLWFLW